MSNHPTPKGMLPWYSFFVLVDEAQAARIAADGSLQIWQTTIQL
jgi:hypothetical protein